MGFIKNAKADVVATEAQKAWDSGSRVLTPLFNFPSSNPGMSGRIEDWEVMINSIESVGWQLHTWAVTTDAKNRPQAMPLFVRP